MRSFSTRGFVLGALLALVAGLIKIFFLSDDYEKNIVGA